MAQGECQSDQDILIVDVALSVKVRCYISGERGLNRAFLTSKSLDVPRSCICFLSAILSLALRMNRRLLEHSTETSGLDEF